MAKILLYQHNVKGYKDGDCVAVIGDDCEFGNKETADRGFLRINLFGVSIEDAHRFTKKYLLNPNTDEEVVLGNRKEFIAYNNTPTPVHPALNKHTKVYALKAGKTIRKHLEKGLTLPIRQQSLAIGVRD